MKSILLIARREFSVRAHSKPIIVLLVVCCVLFIGGGIGAKYLQKSGVLNSDTSLVLTPATQPYRSALAQLGKTPGMPTYDMIRASSNHDAIEKVKNGDADLAFINDKGSWKLISDDNVSFRDKTIFNQIISTETLSEYVIDLGGSGEELANRMNSAHVTVHVLDDKDDSGSNIPTIVSASIILLILFFAIITGMQFIANGVTEEKQSRIVEILLSTVQPFELMVGKILGIGLGVLLSCVILLGSAVIGAHASGYLSQLDISFAAISVWSILFLLAGFFSYAFLCAAFSSLASSQEDVATAIAPLSVVAGLSFYLPYVLMFSSPNSIILTIFSYVPLFSCFTAPVQIAFGSMGTMQALISLLINIVFIIVAARISARIYKNSILHFGARRSLRRALHAR